MALKTNIRMLIVNDAIDATATLTIGNEIATMPLSYLLEYSKSDSFRCLEINKIQFTLVWDEPRILSGIALKKHNLSDLATWQFEAFSDQALTQQLYDSTVANGGQELQAVEQKALGELEFLVDALVSPAVEGKYRDSDHWFDDVLAHAVRVTIKDPSNIYNFIDINQVFIGRALQPEVNFSHGYKFGWQTEVEQKRTRGGSVYGIEKAAIRNFKWTLSRLSETDRPHFVNAIQRVQAHTVWYISMFPGIGGQKERHYAMSCIFNVLPEISADVESIYNATYDVGEA